MIKKIFRGVLTILSLGAVLSCQSPMGIAPKPEGSGKVSVSLGTPARTVVADVASQVTSYAVTLTSNDGYPTLNGSASGGGTVSFDSVRGGSWNVSVTAKNGTTVVGAGTLNSQALTAGASVAWTVPLSTTQSSTGGLSFAFSIPASTQVTKVTAQLYTLAGASDLSLMQLALVTSGDNLVGKVIKSSLVSGAYQLEIRAYRGSGVVGVFREAVNIWDGVISNQWLDPSGALTSQRAFAASEFRALPAVTTLAGNWATLRLDGTGTEATFDSPYAVANDGTNLYVADRYTNLIRKVVLATGEVTTLAGSGEYGFADGLGTSALFKSPKGLAVAGGNLYVADSENHRIRRIVLATGEVTTLAGSGSSGSLDGMGTSATFRFPCNLASDGVHLFVADKSNHKIRKVVIATGEVTTVAGTGTAGYADGTSTTAQFNSPEGVATDGTSVYVGDTSNNKIRRIDLATGTVTTLAGSTAGAANGTGTAAQFNGPVGLETDGTYLFVADNNGGKIRQIEIATGIVSTLAGSGAQGLVNGTGTAASFFWPTGVTRDGAGNLYVADSYNHALRKIVISSKVTSTLAGTPTPWFLDATGTSARFHNPVGVASDGTWLYVADTDNNMIRKIEIATGVVTTLAGSMTAGAADGTGTAARFNRPTGVATDGTNLYVTDTQYNSIRKIVLATGVVTTLAGGTYGSVDGTGTSAQFASPKGLATNGTHLFVCDSIGNMIRQVEISTGIVTTLAGSTTSGSVDGTGTAARFYYPEGIATDGTNLYVAESANSLIRKIVISTGVVTTIAGSARSYGSSDGIGTAARFYYPKGLETDGTYLYVADTYNNKIRKILIATGEVETLAGGGAQGHTDGDGSAALFRSPSAIVVSKTGLGKLFVVDGNYGLIRVVQ